MAKIAFYCRNNAKHLLDCEYYKQDIDALRALGHEVVVCTRYTQLPRRFDALFVWWWTYALMPVLWARARRKPSLITGVFNFEFPARNVGVDYKRRPFWQRGLISLATRLCSLNLFIDHQELDKCQAHFGIENGRHYPLVLDADYLKGPSRERELVLLNIAWSGRKNLIRKGIPDLLKAVAILKEQGFNVRLKLAGLEGDGGGFLEELITEYGIRSQVERLGAVSRAKKIELLRCCEIYVQPSLYEGFGLATAEAMGSGACIITCDVGAVRSVVGDAGIYVSPGAPEKLAEAIRWTTENPMERGRLQAMALHRARSEFGFDDKLRRLEGYLAECGVASPNGDHPTTWPWEKSPRAQEPADLRAS
jgi:glycosyltransferase involved in cell wall biosynthesis